LIQLFLLLLDSVATVIAIIAAPLLLLGIDEYFIICKNQDS